MSSPDWQRALRCEERRAFNRAQRGTALALAKSRRAIAEQSLHVKQSRLRHGVMRGFLLAFFLGRRGEHNRE